MRKKIIIIGIIAALSLLVISLGIHGARLRRQNEMRTIITDPKAAESLSHDELMEYLDSGDNLVVNNTLTFLEIKRDPFAVDRAKVFLKSPDDYIWLCAAMYLGACNEEESIPYLIKGLRHTASRSDQRRVDYLQKMTGQNLGTDFARWKSWYEGSGHKTDLDWDSSLGAKPRI